MKSRFTSQQLAHIREQALIYQCACPAQVSQLLSEMQNLYAYQLACVNRDDVDVQVHQTIAAATGEAYALMEQCLVDVLRIEGWDPETLTLPAALQEKFLRQLDLP